MFIEVSEITLITLVMEHNCSRTDFTTNVMNPGSGGDTVKQAAVLLLGV